MKALVIGGGIAGLSAALSLHQAGIEVLVFETVRNLDALGSASISSPTPFVG